jgi:hypothetical protein
MRTNLCGIKNDLMLRSAALAARLEARTTSIQIA